MPFCADISGKHLTVEPMIVCSKITTANWKVAILMQAKSLTALPSIEARFYRCSPLRLSYLKIELAGILIVMSASVRSPVVVHVDVMGHQLMVPGPDLRYAMYNPLGNVRRVSIQPQAAKRESIANSLVFGAGWIPLLPCERWISVCGWVCVPEPRNKEMRQRLSHGGDRQVRIPTPLLQAAPPLIGSC